MLKANYCVHFLTFTALEDPDRIISLIISSYPNFLQKAKILWLHLKIRNRAKGQ